MTDAQHAGLSPASVETIAGLAAGSIATLTVHPLDIVKTRMQSMPAAIHGPSRGRATLKSIRELTLLSSTSK